jgi:hypothetical protein
MMSGGKDFVGMVTHDVMQGRGPAKQQRGGTTYPGQKGPAGSASSFVKDNHVKARYKMFDLSRESQVLELETLMTEACTGSKMIREERWSHDKDGLTVVTVSWLDITPKKKRKHGPEFYREGEDPDEYDHEDMDGSDEVAHVTKPEPV